MRLLVFGAGGHARSVIDAARTAGWEIAGVIGRPGDPDAVLGHPVTHDASGVEADGFVVAVGDNGRRRAAFEEHRARGLVPVTVVHPSAILGGNVEVGAGSFLAAGVVVNVNAGIGENAILNTGCSVDHDCVVGAHTLVGPGANLCGETVLGEGVLLGAGASVVPGASVGEWSVVGAGAAVTGDLPPRCVCAGVPARVLRLVE
ncbi:MAG: acetyltransferase [Coriobacteriia bacterium]|nr:acetyltransferase [Coriobacteriia bacterium]